MNNSRILWIKNAKSSGQYFHTNTHILGDFQICISVPFTLTTVQAIVINENSWTKKEQKRKGFFSLHPWAATTKRLTRLHMHIHFFTDIMLYPFMFKSSLFLNHFIQNFARTTVLSSLTMFLQLWAVANRSIPRKCKEDLKRIFLWSIAIKHEIFSSFQFVFSVVAFEVEQDGFKKL